jgi:CRP-like cAMP-binding protein
MRCRPNQHDIPNVFLRRQSNFSLFPFCTCHLCHECEWNVCDRRRPRDASLSKGTSSRATVSSNTNSNTNHINSSKGNGSGSGMSMASNNNNGTATNSSAFLQPFPATTGTGTHLNVMSDNDFGEPPSTPLLLDNNTTGTQLLLAQARRRARAAVRRHLRQRSDAPPIAQLPKPIGSNTSVRRTSSARKRQSSARSAVSETRALVAQLMSNGSTSSANNGSGRAFEQKSSSSNHRVGGARTLTSSASAPSLLPQLRSTNHSSVNGAPISPVPQSSSAQKIEQDRRVKKLFDHYYNEAVKQLEEEQRTAMIAAQNEINASSPTGSPILGGKSGTFLSRRQESIERRGLRDGTPSPSNAAAQNMRLLTTQLSQHHLRMEQQHEYESMVVSGIRSTMSDDEESSTDESTDDDFNSDEKTEADPDDLWASNNATSLTFASLFGHLSHIRSTNDGGNLPAPITVDEDKKRRKKKKRQSFKSIYAPENLSANSSPLGSAAPTPSPTTPQPMLNADGMTVISFSSALRVHGGPLTPLQEGSEPSTRSNGTGRNHVSDPLDNNTNNGANSVRVSYRAPGRSSHSMSQSSLNPSSPPLSPLQHGTIPAATTTSIGGVLPSLSPPATGASRAHTPNAQMGVPAAKLSEIRHTDGLKVDLSYKLRKQNNRIHAKREAARGAIKGSISPLPPHNGFSSPPLPNGVLLTPLTNVTHLLNSTPNHHHRSLASSPLPSNGNAPEGLTISTSLTARIRVVSDEVSPPTAAAILPSRPSSTMPFTPRVSSSSIPIALSTSSRPPSSTPKASVTISSSTSTSKRGSLVPSTPRGSGAPQLTLSVNPSMTSTSASGITPGSGSMTGPMGTRLPLRSPGGGWRKLGGVERPRGPHGRTLSFSDLVLDEKDHRHVAIENDELQWVDEEAAKADFENDDDTFRKMRRTASTLSNTSNGSQHSLLGTTKSPAPQHRIANIIAEAQADKPKEKISSSPPATATPSGITIFTDDSETDNTAPTAAASDSQALGGGPAGIFDRREVIVMGARGRRMSMPELSLPPESVLTLPSPSSHATQAPRIPMGPTHPTLNPLSLSLAGIVTEMSEADKRRDRALEKALPRPPASADGFSVLIKRVDDDADVDMDEDRPATPLTQYQPTIAEWLITRPDFQAMYQNDLDTLCINALQDNGKKTKLEIIKIKEWISGVPYFTRLPLPMQNKLTRLVGVEKYSKGSVIYSKSDLGDRIYMMKSGKCLLTTETTESRVPTAASSVRAQAAKRGMASVREEKGGHSKHDKDHGLSSARQVAGPTSQATAVKAVLSPDKRSLLAKIRQWGANQQAAEAAAAANGTILPPNAIFTPTMVTVTPPATSGTNASHSRPPVTGPSASLMQPTLSSAHRVTISPPSSSSSTVPPQSSSLPARVATPVLHGAHAPPPLKLRAAGGATPKSTMLSHGDSFGHRIHLDRNMRERKEMLKMSRAQRLWRKLFAKSKDGTKGSQGDDTERSRPGKLGGGLMDLIREAESSKRKETVVAVTDVVLLTIAWKDFERIEKMHQDRITRETVDLLASLDVFSDWKHRRLRRLANMIECRSYEPGGEISLQGTPADRICFIQSGSVRIKKSAKETSFYRWPTAHHTWEVVQRHHNRTWLVDTLTAPNYFHEEALLECPTLDFSAVAKTKVDLLILKKTHFLDMFQESTLSLFRRRVNASRCKALRQVHSAVSARNFPIPNLVPPPGVPGGNSFPLPPAATSISTAAAAAAASAAATALAVPTLVPHVRRGSVSIGPSGASAATHRDGSSTPSLAPLAPLVAAAAMNGITVSGLVPADLQSVGSPHAPGSVPNQPPAILPTFTVSCNVALDLNASDDPHEVEEKEKSKEGLGTAIQGDRTKGYTTFVMDSEVDDAAEDVRLRQQQVERAIDEEMKRLDGEKKARIEKASPQSVARARTDRHILLAVTGTSYYYAFISRLNVCC